MEEQRYNQQNQPAPIPVQEDDYDEIDIMELLLKLLSNWKKLLLWCGVSAVVGIVVAFSIPRQYTVTSKMAPEIVTKTSGSVASIASMLGANISNMTTNDAVYPDLYPDIVSSTPFVTELFSLPVQFKDKKEGMVNTDYYTYLKEYTKSPWWSVVLSAPMKGLGWFLGLFREKTEAVEGYADFNPEALTLEGHFTRSQYCCGQEDTDNHSHRDEPVSLRVEDRLGCRYREIAAICDIISYGKGPQGYGLLYYAVR